MKKNYYFLVMLFLLFSCRETKQGDLLEIPIDIGQNISLHISEILDEMIVIEPELTDKSLVNPDRIKRIFLFGDYLIIAEREKIHVFDKEGKFVRSIGSRGQGPGEHTGIKSVALDEKNGCLYVISSLKIICYNFEGKCVKETTIENGWSLADMSFIADELLFVAEQYGRKDDKGKFKRTVLYRMNRDLQITDSCLIRDVYFEQTGLYNHPFEDFILYGDSTVYLYCSDIYFDQQNPAETVLRDTIYRLVNNCLIPELKLKFKNDGIDGGGSKFIQLFSIYRSDRFVFAVYGNSTNNLFYRFCYDVTTGEGHNMQDGYTDDVNHIEKRVSIRPLTTNTEWFYYWYTHIKPTDKEEPNPTIYIGKLKKQLY